MPFTMLPCHCNNTVLALFYSPSTTELQVVMDGGTNTESRALVVYCVNEDSCLHPAHDIPF